MTAGSIEGQVINRHHRRYGQRSVKVREQLAAPRFFPFESRAQFSRINTQKDNPGLAGAVFGCALHDLAGT